MITLTKEQVLMLHDRLIEVTGGSKGIRDEGMLDSALANPSQSFGGEELYPSIQAKAAQAKLSEQTEIIDLPRGLEQSKLAKERQEIEALVNYIGSMESQFGQILQELQDVKGNLSRIKG